MEHIEIYEVKNNKDLRKFISFPNQLYANNAFYIPVVLANEYKTLSPKMNPAFEYCKAKYS